MFVSHGNHLDKCFYGGVTGFMLLLLMPLKSECFIQTSREYQLRFNYDPTSIIGPSRWHEVDPSLVEEWSDFSVFMNTSNHDLKIDDNYCNDPRRPSPVNLFPTTACDDNHEILTKMIKKDDCTFTDMTFEIAPNMLRAFMPYDNTTCRLPTMNLSGDLPNDWTFIWLEVHLRSEHVIDGRRFDGEIQLIHLGNNAQKRELAAPTILLDASSPFDEPKLQRFLDQWQALHDATRQRCFGNQGVQENLQSETSNSNSNDSSESSFFSLLDKYTSSIINFFGGNSSGNTTESHSSRYLQTSNTTLSQYGQPFGPRRKMFPYDLFPTIYYYKYQGSITYPPCSQIVRFRVLDEPLKISRRQLRQLGALQGSYLNEHTCESASVVSPLGENYRPLQVLNPVFQNSSHCKPERYRLWQYPTAYQ